MNWTAILKAVGLDRYDRNARLYPAFLSLLPIFLVLALGLPQVWTLLGGIASLAGFCGSVFLLAQIVRYFGRKVEAQLGDRVGRARSAILLSHSDPRIPTDTKARYHKYLMDHGLDIPSIDFEASAPVEANQKFRSAVDWLLEHTRASTKASMLLDENISYGFRRNLLGVKPVALALIVLAIAINLYLSITCIDHNRMVADSVLELLLILGLMAWGWVVRPDFVEDASMAYAQRFLAQCESTQAPKRGRSSKASK